MSTPDPAPMIETARAIAIAAGCNCHVEITITELVPGVHHATVAHDDHCPLLAHRPRGRN